jgi:hypothetical protein
MTKILNAQTTSGYSVNKKFAKTLLENFKEGLILLKQTHNLELYSLDQYWKILQPISKWYCLKPKIGKQIKSYSDNFKGIIDPGC